jgi:hypothetical protein
MMELRGGLSYTERQHMDCVCSMYYSDCMCSMYIKQALSFAL